MHCIKILPIIVGQTNLKRESALGFYFTVGLLIWYYDIFNWIDIIINFLYFIILRYFNVMQTSKSLNNLIFHLNHWFL